MLRDGPLLGAINDADGCLYGTYYDILLLMLIAYRSNQINQLASSETSFELKKIIAKELINYIVSSRRTIASTFKGSLTAASGTHDGYAAIEKLRVLTLEVALRVHHFQPQLHFPPYIVIDLKLDYLDKLKKAGELGAGVNEVLLLQANSSWSKLLQDRVMQENFAILSGITGSMRQNDYINRVNIFKNGTGDIFGDGRDAITSVARLINRRYDTVASISGKSARRVIGVFEPLLMADIQENTYTGSSHQLILNQTRKEKTDVSHPTCVFDSSKFTMLIAILQYYRISYPGRAITLCLFEDMNIIHELNMKIFSLFPDLIPQGVTLEFYYYCGDEMTDMPNYPNRLLHKVIGTGPIDWHYRESVKYLHKLCGANASHYLGATPLDVGKILCDNYDAPGRRSTLISQFITWRAANISKPLMPVDYPSDAVLAAAPPVLSAASAAAAPASSSVGLTASVYSLFQTVLRPLSTMLHSPASEDQPEPPRNL